MSTLPSPPEALASLLRHAQPFPTTRIPLTQAAQHTLAQDLPSPIDHPSFDQSAVDGYAFRYDDLTAQGSLAPTQIRAGDPATQPVLPGTCVRIFTGAPLPPGADTVVMQEHTRVEGDQLSVLDARLSRHGNVRFRAEQIRKGETALQAGQVLDAAAIGYLATLGIDTVPVHRRPKVAILVTGNEFAARHADLQHGRIYESNGQMLQAALRDLAEGVTILHVAEDRAAMETAIAEASTHYDLLIATGGVSVGDHDHTQPAFAALGYATLVHGVAQKPGKPLYIGLRDGKVAFGLPGNPRAVLVCFYCYVLPYLHACMGQPAPGLRTLTLPLAEAWRRKPDGKTHFVTGRFRDGSIAVIDDRASHMLRSFAGADGIVVLPPEPAEFPAGTLVEVRLLPR
jgi:molybdopterin molybdotransferase